jgi:hypothetical protein
MLFDAAFYLETNPDVADAGFTEETAINHYLEFGFEEGRDPHPLFDTSFYFSQRLDVLDVGAEPFGHYLDFGFEEDSIDGTGLQSDPNRFFDSAEYLAQNQDVALAGANPLVHYLNFGEQEIIDGTRESPSTFDPAFYATQNPDVADAVAAGSFGSFLEHFLRFGLAEGRLPLPPGVIDPEFVLSDIEQTDPSVTLALNAVPGVNPLEITIGDDANGDGEATVAARPDATDALNLRGDASVRIDLTDPFEQLEQIDLDGDGTIEVGTEEFNVRPKVDVQHFEIIDAHPRPVLDDDGNIVGAGALLDPTDSENGFTGDIIFDGTGFDGDGSSTDGNIVLGGAGDDVVLGGIGNDFFSGGGGQNVLSGGRNADFFYQELSTLDVMFTGVSEIKGGTTGDEPGQDFDWLLLEASDDQELVTVNLNTNVSDTSGTPGSVVTENGGPGQQFFGGSAAFIEDIENVNASGSFYGFLDITEGVGFASETILSITTDDLPGQDTGSGNRFDSVLQINFTIDGETLEADETVIVADGLSDDADEALDQIIERLDDFFAAQSGGDFEEFTNLDAREGVRDGRPALEIIDDEGRFVGVSVRGEAIVDGINVFEFNVARDAVFPEEKILPDLFFGDFRDFSDDDAAVPRIPRLSPGVTAQTEIIGTESETNVLIGGYDNDRIYGLSGNDLLFGGDLEFLLTHQNNVNLFDSDGTISVNAQDGVADDGRDTLLGGAGDDNVVLELDGGAADGGEGDDTLWLTTFTPGRTGDVSLSTDGSIEQRFILTNLLGVNQDVVGTQEATPEAAALAALTTDSAIRLDLGYAGFDGYGADRDGTADQTFYNSGFDATTITSVENINASGLGGIDYLAAGGNDPELNFENQQNFRATHSDLVLRGQDNDEVFDLVISSNGFDGVGSVASPFDITNPSGGVAGVRPATADFTADFLSVLTEDDLDTAPLEAFDEEFDNILIGGFGDDTIEGRGGTDRLSGREGDDTFLFTLGFNDVNNAGGSGEDFRDENPSNAIAGDGINFINRDLDIVDQNGEAGQDNVFTPNQTGTGDRVGQDFRSEVGDVVADDTLSVIQLTGDFADGLRWDLVEAIVIVREDGANLTAGADFFGEQLENDPATSEEVAAALNTFFDSLATSDDEDIAALAGAVRAEATDDITVTIAGDPGDFAFAGAQVQQGEPEEGLDGGFLVDNQPQVIVEEGEDDEIVFLSYQNREDNELTQDESVGLGRDSYAEDLVYSFANGTTELVEDQGYRITFAELKDFDEISVTINGWTFTEEVDIVDVTQDGSEGNVRSQTTLEAVQDLVDQINAKIAADPHTELGLLVTTDAVAVDVDGDGVPDTDGASFTISEDGFLDATDEDVYIEAPTVTVTNDDGNEALYAVEDLSQTRVSLTNFDGAPAARGLNKDRDHLEQRGEGEGDVADFGDRYITFEGDFDGNDVGINRAILQTANPESSETLQGLDVAVFASSDQDIETDELTLNAGTAGTNLASHPAQRDFSFADSPDVDEPLFIKAAEAGDQSDDVGQPVVGGFVAKHGDDLLIGSDAVDEIAAGTGDDRVQASFSDGTGDDQVDGGVNIVVSAGGQILFDDDGDLLQEVEEAGQILVPFEDRLIFDERDFLEDTRDPGDITYSVTLGAAAVAEDFSLDGTVDVIDKPSGSVIATTDFTNFEIVRLLTKAGMETLTVTDFSDASDGGVFYDNTGFQGLVRGSVEGDTGEGNILGVETVIGGDGTDQFIGWTVAESFIGGDNVDTLSGGGGNDTLSGGDGDDSLRGGDGNDSMTGGSDNSVDDDEADANPTGDESGDTMVGGLGADTMIGGPGNDLFVYETFDDSEVADENFAAFDEGDTVDTTALDIISFNDDDENEEFDLIDLTALTGPLVGDISQGNWGGNTFTFGSDPEDDDAFVTITDGAGVVEMQFVVLNAFNDPAGAADFSESDILGVVPPNAVTVAGTVVDGTLDEGQTAQITLDPDVAPNSDILIGIDVTFGSADADDLENIATSVTLPANSDAPVTVDIADIVADATDEPAETFSVSIDTGRGNTALAPDSFDFTINSELDPVVTDVTASQTTVNETDNTMVTFTLDTANQAGGETIDLTFNSVTGTFNDDDVVGTLPATVTAEADGTTDVTLEIVADDTTEGDEVFTLSAAIGGQTPATSAEVTVTDTSLDPVIVDQSLDLLGGTQQFPAAFDAGTDSFRFTDDVNVQSFVEISNFGADDEILYTGTVGGNPVAEADINVDPGSNTTLLINNGGIVSQIELVGVATGLGVQTIPDLEAAIGTDVMFA